MKNNKIVDILMSVFGIIVALLLIVFQKQNNVLFVIAFCGCIIFGILLLIKKNKIGLLLSGVGIGGISSLLIYFYKVLSFGSTVTFFFFLSLLVMLVLALITGIIYRKETLKQFNLIVDAEVVDLIKNPNLKKDYYMPIYKYEVDGNEYFVDDLYRHSFVPNIGQIKKINVDPNEPTQVFFLPSKFEDIKNIFGCIFLSILCLIVLISLF